MPITSTGPKQAHLCANAISARLQLPASTAALAANHTTALAAASSASPSRACKRTASEAGLMKEQYSLACMRQGRQQRRAYAVKEHTQSRAHVRGCRAYAEGLVSCNTGHSDCLSWCVDCSTGQTTHHRQSPGTSSQSHTNASTSRVGRAVTLQRGAKLSSCPCPRQAWHALPLT